MITENYNQIFPGLFVKTVDGNTLKGGFELCRKFHPESGERGAYFEETFFLSHSDLKQLVEFLESTTDGISQI